MNIEKFENRVENIDLDNITQDDIDLIKEIVQKLDNGEIRVVEKIDNEWVVNEWVKKSISFSSKLISVPNWSQIDLVSFEESFFSSLTLSSALL